jgi:putative hydrolase of the HAD superfamily
MRGGKRISTVFFDFGDTLVEGRPAYLKRVTDLLGEFGFEAEYSDVVLAFNRADYLVYVDISSGNLDGENSFLARFLDHFARCLDMEIDWEAILPEITRRFEREVFDRILCERAVETLDALQSEGRRLGIISNNDGKCREKCEEMGIDKYFEIIIDSTVEGVSKPAPAIFELALGRMKISPSEAAHVGDMYGADVMGARDAGLAPVWYNRSGLKPQADYRPDLEVERLTRIPEIL